MIQYIFSVSQHIEISAYVYISRYACDNTLNVSLDTIFSLSQHMKISTCIYTYRNN